MKTLLLLLLLLASPAHAQWVKVQSEGKGTSTYTGSGVTVAYKDGRGVFICSGHQFRDWDGGEVTIDGQAKARVLFHQNTSELDLAILQAVTPPAGNNHHAAVLAKQSPQKRTSVYLYRDGKYLSGYWEPRKYLDQQTYEQNITKSGKYRGMVKGVTSGWSGGPVYDESRNLIGMTVNVDDASGSTMVYWTPVEKIRAALNKTLPGLVAEPRVVFVGVRKGCFPCDTWKKDLAAGEFAGRDVVFEVVEAGTSDYQEVIQQIQQQGYRPPQQSPWFWSTRCNCSPLVDYRGVPWLLAWLPPPFTPPHDPERYQRSPQPQIQPMPDPLFNQELSALKAQLEAARQKLEAGDPRLDNVLKTIQGLEGKVSDGFQDPRFDDLKKSMLDAVAGVDTKDPRVANLQKQLGSNAELLGLLKDRLGQPGTETTKATGFFAELAGVASDAAGAASTAQIGAVGGPAGVAGVWAATTLFNYWRRKKREKNNPGGFVPGTHTAVPEPFPVTVENAAPDARVIHATHFQNIPVDLTNEAYEWARSQMGQKYPGSVGNLTMLHSMMEQYIAARKKT